MVDYPTFVGIMHDAYESELGRTANFDVAQELTSLASDVWNEYKEDIIALAAEAALEYAKLIIRRKMVA